MFNSIKELVKEKKKKRFSRLKRNEKGDLLFEMQLSKEQLYSPFSISGRRFLNPALEHVFDGIMEEATPKDSIEILIHTENPCEERRAKFESILDEYYLTKLEIAKRNFGVKIGQGLIMLFIGVLLFAGYFLLETFFTTSMWLELLDIASWVFVWEFVDTIFIGLLQHRLAQRKFKQIVNATITFTDPMPTKKPTEDKPKNKKIATKKSTTTTKNKK